MEAKEEKALTETKEEQQKEFSEEKESQKGLDETKARSVIRQVEFYFSDSNLPRDKFLRKTVEESEDGLVSLALICTFGRMKSHLDLHPSIKPETVSDATLNAVSAALRQSSLLRLSEDGKRVGRIGEMLKPEEVIEQTDSRTVAVSPLPFDVNIEQIESFFNERAKVNSVRLLRHVSDKRQFCGTALIEFSDEEDAKNILNESLVFAGAELELKPKKEFDTEREKEREKHEKIHPRKGEPEGSYTKGLIIAFKLKKAVASGVNMEKSEGEEKGEKEKEKGKQETSEEGGESKSEKSEGDNSIVMREDLNKVFSKFGKVKFIDFTMGLESGFVRFEEPIAGEKARAFAALQDEGGLIVKNQIATLESLSGEEEKNYWKEIHSKMEKIRENKNYNNRGGRGGKSNYSNNRGKRQSDSTFKGSNKTRKLDIDE